MSRDGPRCAKPDFWLVRHNRMNGCAFWCQAQAVRMTVGKSEWRGTKSWAHGEQSALPATLAPDAAASTASPARENDDHMIAPQG